jgi:hypothetical protein
MTYEKLRKKEAMEEGSQYAQTLFQPDTRLSVIKEPFFLDIVAALKELQTKKAWCNGLFEKTFDPVLVIDDVQNGGTIYFAFVLKIVSLEIKKCRCHSNTNIQRSKYNLYFFEK